MTAEMTDPAIPIAADPFTQGYIEALLRDYQAQVHGDANAGLGFRDLAPETLEWIMADCAEMVRPESFTFEPSREAGAFCWSARQAGWYVMSGRQGLRDAFPPLHVYLGADGKIYLRDQADGQKGEGEA